jgi:hypothetical protein
VEPDLLHAKSNAEQDMLLFAKKDAKRQHKQNVKINFHHFDKLQYGNKTF